MFRLRFETVQQGFRVELEFVTGASAGRAISTRSTISSAERPSLQKGAMGGNAAL